MGCCGKPKQLVSSGAKKTRQIATGYSNLVRGKKYEFTDGRVRICQGCKSKYWLGKKLFCSICKCFVPAKARVKESTCPLGKWEK